MAAFLFNLQVSLLCVEDVASISTRAIKMIITDFRKHNVSKFPKLDLKNPQNALKPFAISSLVHFLLGNNLTALQTKSIVDDADAKFIFEMIRAKKSVDAMLAINPDVAPTVALVVKALNRACSYGENATVASNGLYVSQLAERGKIDVASGVNVLNAPTGTGKNYYLIGMEKSILATSLALTAQQQGDEYSGVSVHAPSVYTDVVFDVSTNSFYLPTERAATTYASAEQVLMILPNSETITVDEFHNSWTAFFRAKQIQEMFDSIYESGVENIIGATGTMDFTSSHPLFAHAKSTKITNDLKVDYKIDYVSGVDAMANCIGRIVSSKERGSFLVFLNSKQQLLDKFLVMCESAGIDSESIAQVNSLTSHIYAGTDLSKFRVVVCTGVMQEGYSLYGNWLGIHLLSFASPAVIHQITQRTRKTRPTVYWYVNSKCDEVKEGDAPKMATYKEVALAQEDYKNHLLKRAYAITQLINDALAHGYTDEALVSSYGVDAEIVHVHYSGKKPLYASINFIAIDCKAYAYGVTVASLQAKQEWLGMFGGVFSDADVPVATVESPDAEQLQAMKLKREEINSTIVDEIFSDGIHVTSHRATRKDYTKLPHGKEWRTLAQYTLEIHGALNGDEQTWKNACALVKLAEYSESAIQQFISVLRNHNRQSHIDELVFGMLASYKEVSLTEIAIDFCKLQIKYGLDVPYNEFLVTQLVIESPEKNKRLLAKVAKKIKNYAIFTSKEKNKKRVYSFSETAYSFLMQELVANRDLLIKETLLNNSSSNN